MDEEIVKEIVDEICSSLESLDTQNAGLAEFLKAKGIASDEELAPYLEQAGKASNVRWLAVRIRINSLITSALKTLDTKAGGTNAEEKKTADKRAERTSGGEEQTGSEPVEGKRSDEKATQQSKGTRSAEQAEGEKSGDEVQRDKGSQGEKSKTEPASKDENKKDSVPNQPGEARKKQDAA